MVNELTLYKGNRIYANSSNMATANFKTVDQVKATYNGKTYTSDFTISIPAGSTANISLGTTTGSKYCLTWSSSNTGAVTVNKSKGAGAVIKATGVGAKSSKINVYSPRGRHMTITVNVTGTKFIVRYKPNGGTGTQMPDTVVTYGTTKTTSKCTYTKKGHTMAGWNVYHTGLKKFLYEKTSQDRKWFASDSAAKAAGYPKKAVYSNGTKVTSTTSIHNAVIEFRAVWKPNTYYAAYYADHPDAAGTMKNSTHTYGVKSYTSRCAFSVPGYTFKGWYVYIPSEKKWSYVNSAGDVAHFANDTEAAKSGYTKKMSV